MKKDILLFLLGITILTSCLGDDYYDEIVITQDSHQKETARSSNNRNGISVGAENAVKKAYQMTDLLFTPRNPIEYNSGVYLPWITYKGLIYSSVKETETYVGECVSFHTFITAVNNPKSRLYTVRLDQYPYHGVNCKSYYGTVCSGLVSYALGLVPRYSSSDFPESDLMDMVDHTSVENLQVADILWREGHVALITDIISDENNMVSEIEISESPSYNCKRYTVSRDYFQNTVMCQNFSRVYRYRDIEKNLSYTPISDIDDDNDNPAICVDKGDRSCYLEGEDVVLNILSDGGTNLEIYKDGKFFMDIPLIQDEDVVLEELPYGDYEARVVYYDESTGINSPKMSSGKIHKASNMLNSDFTCWKIVNTEVKYDNDNSTLYFNSLNARPSYVVCCKENGTRPLLKSGFYHVFTDDEIDCGHIEVDREKMSESYPYMKLFFETDYGTIINTPINCFE